MTARSSGIAAHGLSKQYGSTAALVDVSLRARPGRVTALLGRNGAGKSTMLSIMAGLTRGEGRVEFDGTELADLTCPPQLVGFVLEGGGFHPNRSARNHLRMLARATGAPAGRIDECLALVGLDDRGGDAPRAYSYGMRQRLALASALLTDPPIVIMDEPLNGLDPPGTVWVRRLLRRMADEGRTVLLSSHNLPEVEQVADDVYIIESGRIVRQGTLHELLDGPRTTEVTVRADDIASLAGELRGRGLEVIDVDDTTIRVLDTTARDVGLAARDVGAVLLLLREQQARLEDVVMDLQGAGAAA